ncbi:MAG: AgmX/PglI C-terminal domain-containing protein [Myxococcota bacterium]
MPRPIQLEVWRGDALVEATTLSQDVIKIGRLSSSHIRLDDDAVARMHAVIEVGDRGLRVVDLGSSAGTQLNGTHVDKSAPMQEGDALSFGAYQVRVRAAAPAVAHAAAPAPVRAQRPAAVIGLHDVEQADAPEVAEVMAMYGDTVLDVQHVGRRGRRRSAAPWLALGGAMLLGGIGFFASQTVMQSEAWSTYEAAKADAATAGRPAPAAPGSSWSGVGIALAFLGLVPLGVGMTRMRDEDSSRYTIGEGESTSFATPAKALPSPAAFPLVSQGPAGDTCVQFAPGMAGHVTVGDQRYSLTELVSSGQASTNGSAFAFSLPSGARCRIQHDDVTFHVNSVAPGKVVAGRADSDKSFWLYNAASLAAIGTLLGLAQLAMPDQGDLALDDAQSFNRFVGYIQQPNEEEDEEIVPDEQPNVDDKALAEPGDPGHRARGAEGKMGKPDSKVAEQHRFAMKGPKDSAVQMTRNFSPDIEARQAGILGMIQQDSGHFLASPDGGAFAMGTDDMDAWGNMTGTDIGEAHGYGGLGLVGTGRGGGGDGKGVLGLGKVGLIGSSGSGGNGVGYSHGRGAGFKQRKRGKPIVRATKSVVRGALDKDIIRRVVKNHINQVRHCYNEGLVRDPTLRGRVKVQFSIGATGKVPMAVVAETSLKDKNVGNCIAKAVKRWRFPKPDGGGTVMVTYPFVLNPG